MSHFLSIVRDHDFQDDYWTISENDTKKFYTKNNKNISTNANKEDYHHKYAKVYLRVPYHQKDDAKRHGAWWDSNCCKWYIPQHCNRNNRTYLLRKYK